MCWINALGVIAGMPTDIRENPVMDIKAQSVRTNEFAVYSDASVPAFFVTSPVPAGICNVHIRPESFGDAIFNHVNSYLVGWPLAVCAVQGHLLIV
jgi:hypothetical protein